MVLRIVQEKPQMKFERNPCIRFRDNCDPDDGRTDGRRTDRRRTTDKSPIPWALLTESNRAKQWLRMVISVFFCTSPTKCHNIQSQCHWVKGTFFQKNKQGIAAAGKGTRGAVLRCGRAHRGSGQLLWGPGVDLTRFLHGSKRGLPQCATKRYFDNLGSANISLCLNLTYIIVRFIETTVDHTTTKKKNTSFPHYRVVLRSSSCTCNCDVGWFILRASNIL